MNVDHPLNIINSISASELEDSLIVTAEDSLIVDGYGHNINNYNDNKSN